MQWWWDEWWTENAEELEYEGPLPTSSVMPHQYGYYNYLSVTIKTNARTSTCTEVIGKGQLFTYLSITTTVPKLLCSRLCALNLWVT